jgi:hypothetical protein
LQNDNHASRLVRLAQLSREVPEAMRQKRFGDALAALSKIDQTVSVLRMDVHKKIAEEA